MICILYAHIYNIHIFPHYGYMFPPNTINMCFHIIYIYCILYTHIYNTHILYIVYTRACVGYTRC